MSLTATNRTLLLRLGKVLLFCAAILCTTKLTLELSFLSSPSTAAFSFLIIVLFSAYFGDIFVAIVTSLVATLCFDYFYIPPVGSLHIYEYSDWISLSAFLIATMIVSRLTASAAESKKNATELNATVLQLVQFGDWLSSIPEEELTLSVIAKGVLDIFSLEFCSIYICDKGKWQNMTGTAASPIIQETEKHLKLVEDHPAHLIDWQVEILDMPEVRYIPVAKGQMPQILLAVKGKTLPTNAIGTVASMIGLRLDMCR